MKAARKDCRSIVSKAGISGFCARSASQAAWNEAFIAARMTSKSICSIATGAGRRLRLIAEKRVMWRYPFARRGADGFGNE